MKTAVAMRPIVALILTVVVAGCGGRDGVYPVEGKVVFEDGQPATELAGGIVFFQAIEGGSTARGKIEKDGSFVLSTNKTGDGAKAGKNKVSVTPWRPGPDQPRPEPAMHHRFASAETSGIEITVEPRSNRDVEVRVERIKK